MSFDSVAVWMPIALILRRDGVRGKANGANQFKNWRFC